MTLSALGFSFVLMPSCHDPFLFCFIFWGNSIFIITFLRFYLYYYYHYFTTICYNYYFSYSNNGQWSTAIKHYVQNKKRNQISMHKTAFGQANNRLMKRDRLRQCCFFCPYRFSVYYNFAICEAEVTKGRHTQTRTGCGIV